MYGRGDPVSPSCVLYVPMMPLLRSLLNATGGSFTNGPDLTAEGDAPTSTEPPYGLESYWFPKQSILRQDNGRVQRFPGWDNRREPNEVPLFVEQSDPCAWSIEPHIFSRNRASPDHLPVRDPFSSLGAKTECREPR